MATEAHIHVVAVLLRGIRHCSVGRAANMAEFSEGSGWSRKAYREALALGGTVSLPSLFQAAGARFAFDAEMLGSAVSLVEQKLDETAVIAHRRMC